NLNLLQHQGQIQLHSGAQWSLQTLTVKAAVLNMSFNLSALFPLSEQTNIPAEPGQTVTLPCTAPNNSDPKAVVEWSITDLGTACVLLYWDGHFERHDQHPSFKNQVDLQDRRMKDGDVSLILKDVTINDTGRYECRVFRRGTKCRRRAHVRNGSQVGMRVEICGAGKRKCVFGAFVCLV
uniref:Ig-like domain-containing protein n=1 Tax=Amphilophus citrinellus TaxID=61819 RepID=A0A3Q0RBS1_AMPCI